MLLQKGVPGLAVLQLWTRETVFMRLMYRKIFGRFKDAAYSK
jgi:hypothetical protein